MGCCLLARRRTYSASSVLLVCILVLSHVCMGAVSAPAKSFGDHVKQEMLSPDDDTARYQRRYKLYNKCSQNHVQLLGMKVLAKGTETDEFAELLVTTRTFNSQVTIQSKRSLRFLCFNRHGRLVLRSSGDNSRCHFLEEQPRTDTHTRFVSVADSTWMMGFKKNGKPLKANAWLDNSKLKRCYTFLKRGDAGSPSVVPSAPVPWGPGVDFSKHAKVTLDLGVGVQQPHRRRHHDGDKPRRKSRTRKLRRGKTRKKG